MKHCVSHSANSLTRSCSGGRYADDCADSWLSGRRCAPRGSIIWFIGSVWFLVRRYMPWPWTPPRGDNPASKLEIGRSPRRARVGGPFNWLLRAPAISDWHFCGLARPAYAVKDSLSTLTHATVKLKLSTRSLAALTATRSPLTLGFVFFIFNLRTAHWFLLQLGL